MARRQADTLRLALGAGNSRASKRGFDCAKFHCKFRMLANVRRVAFNCVGELPPSSLNLVAVFRHQQVVAEGNAPKRTKLMVSRSREIAAKAPWTLAARLTTSACPVCLAPAATPGMKFVTTRSTTATA